MARKSRRTEIADLQNGIIPMTSDPVSLIYDTALYGRLSILDTRDRKGSESLENQMELLKHYIAGKSDLRLFSCYCDNGETGTNFDRPAFQRMMEDVKAGRVNCIIVKDLSRFGRDFLETGNLLEKVLPFLGVRFISVNDSYDSADSDSGNEGMTVALKNLVNDIYAKDISKKVFSSLDTKKRNGEFIGNYSAYGYLKSPEDKHKLIIDEEIAPVVRQIFKLKADGIGNAVIARLLTAEGVLNPNKYRYDKGIIFSERFAENTPWGTQAVKGILTNPVYLGNMVQGKKITKLYENQRQKIVPQADWIIVENTHEPIIGRELYETVQKIIRQKKDEYHGRLGKYDYFEKTENIFMGLVICGSCGHKMIRYKEVYNKGRQMLHQFICPNYAMHLTAACQNSGGIREEKLTAIVYDVLRSQMDLLADTEQIIKRVTKSAGYRERRTAIFNEITNVEARQKKLKTLRQSLFESYVQSVIPEADYLFATDKYDSEHKYLSHRLEELTIEKSKLLENAPEENKWYMAFRKFKEESVLSREMLVALTQKIVVNNDKEVVVILRYQDEMKAIFQSAENKGSEQYA